MGMRSCELIKSSEHSILGRREVLGERREEKKKQNEISLEWGSPSTAVSRVREHVASDGSGEHNTSYHPEELENFQKNYDLQLDTKRI